MSVAVMKKVLLIVVKFVKKRDKITYKHIFILIIVIFDLFRTNLSS